MKKIFISSLIALISMPAMASADDAARLRTYIDLSSMKFEQGKNLGTAGVGFEGQFATTDKTTVGARVYAGQTQNKNSTNATNLDGAINMAYHFQVGDSATISPRVGIGHEYIGFKVDGDKVKHQRSYVEIGVGARVNLNDDWSFQPDIAFQQDVHTTSKVNNVNVDAKNGNKYTVEFGFARSTGTGFGEVVIAPFYRHYTIKYKNGIDSSANQYGLRLGYTF